MHTFFRYELYIMKVNFSRVKNKLFQHIANENKWGIVPTKKGVYAMTSKTLFGLLCCLPLIGCDSETKIPEKNTINPEIEQIVQKELEDAVATYQATAATGIIMESKTGEIISMVSVGKIDPMQYVYEMGGQFKVFNTAMAYENGLADKQYTVNQAYVIRDKNGRELITIKDVPSTKKYLEKQGITKMGADDIFLNSCNVGTVQIALDLPDGVQTEFFHRVKLDKVLELDFGKTGKPLLPTKKGVVETATNSFGHGIAITPMHMIASLNAVINEEYVYPTFTKTKDIKAERVVSADVAKHIREDMHKKAELLTANKSKAKNIGLSSATAEKTGEKKAVTTNVFVAFPIDAPKYSMFVFMNDPKGSAKTGGLKTSAWNVIPTAGKILEQIEPMLIK